MLKRPQHIKRKCSEKEFETIEKGLKVHDMRIANIEVSVGDFITYEEVDSNGKDTGNITTRKITCVTNTKELDPATVEIEKYGFTIVSISQPEVNTLRSVFVDHFAMGCVIKKHENKWSIIGGPHYWPLLICPDLSSANILENLKIEMWPDGVYSIHLKIEPEIDESSDKNNPIVNLSIADTFALVCTISENVEPVEIVSADIDIASLMLGTAVSVLGDPILPAHPDEVELYYEDSDTDLRKMNDGMFSVLPKFGDISDEDLSQFLLESEEDGEDLLDDDELQSILEEDNQP